MFSSACPAEARTRDVSTAARLSRMEAQRAAFVARLRSERGAAHEQRLAAFRARLAAERDKRLADRKAERRDQRKLKVTATLLYVPGPIEADQSHCFAPVKARPKLTFGIMVARRVARTRLCITHVEDNRPPSHRSQCEDHVDPPWTTHGG